MLSKLESLFEWELHLHKTSQLNNKYPLHVKQISSFVEMKVRKSNKMNEKGRLKCNKRNDYFIHGVIEAMLKILISRTSR